MSKALLTNNKYSVIAGYFGVILFSMYYIYSTNITMKESMRDTKVDGIIMHYNLYNKIYKVSSKLKDILVEDINYVDTSDMVDEYSQSTPFYIEKNKKQLSKYDLTFKFFNKNDRHSIEIEKNISQLTKEIEYIYKFKENSIYLFGIVPNKGYVLIEKQLTKSFEIKKMIDSFFIKILIAGAINIIIFLYILNLINSYKLHDEQNEIEFDLLKEDTKNLAFKDKLTGADTRIKFDIILEDLLHIASRFDEQKFTLMMIDIDNFKKVNDTYGHDYGDIVLQEVALVARQNMRETDTFARWGGEEFVILSPLTDLKSSYIFANKIRELIASLKFEKLDRITCSFGVTIYEKGDTEKTLMKKADELLYKAKHNGKNRVEI